MGYYNQEFGRHLREAPLLTHRSRSKPVYSSHSVPPKESREASGLPCGRPVPFDTICKFGTSIPYCAREEGCVGPFSSMRLPRFSTMKYDHRWYAHGDLQRPHSLGRGYPSDYGICHERPKRRRNATMMTKEKEERDH